VRESARQAGAEIIAENLRNGGELDPMIPGKRMVAIFGFCDIRQFTDATEVLQVRVGWPPAPCWLSHCADAVTRNLYASACILRQGMRGRGTCGAHVELLCH
jgi:hypothetical protein